MFPFKVPQCFISADRSQPLCGFWADLPFWQFLGRPKPALLAVSGQTEACPLDRSPPFDCFWTDLLAVPGQTEACPLDRSPPFDCFWADRSLPFRKVKSELGIPAHIYSDDGKEFKKEFREALEYWDINKLVTRGHAHFAERMIRTLKEAILRRIAGEARTMAPAAT